jgi:hypothetical protein
MMADMGVHSVPPPAKVRGLHFGGKESKVSRASLAMRSDNVTMINGWEEDLVGEKDGRNQSLHGVNRPICAQQHRAVKCLA